MSHQKDDQRCECPACRAEEARYWLEVHQMVVSTVMDFSEAFRWAERESALNLARDVAKCLVMVADDPELPDTEAGRRALFAPFTEARQ